MIRRSDRLGLFLLASILLASVTLSGRVLGAAANFDEATYTLTLRVLAAGGELGSDVFGSQPPLFYDLLRGVGLLAPDTVDGLRMGMIVLSALAVVVAYALGATYAGPAGGIGAALLLAATPVVARNAPLVEAEPPALLLSLGALLAAARGFGEERGRRRAFAAGALAAAAILVKLLAATVLLPLIAIAFAERASRRQLLPLAAGAGAIGVATAVAHYGELGAIVHDAVGFHLDARDTTVSADDDLQRLRSFLHPRNPATYLIVAGLAAALLPGNRRLWPLWSFAAAALAFTLVMEPLLDHHLALLGTAVAVPAGAALGHTLARAPRGAAAALAILVGIAGIAGFAQLHREVKTIGEARETRDAADALRAEIAIDRLVVVDEPMIALLADRLVPGELVDTSAVRFATGSLTGNDVLAAAASPRVGAAAAGRMFTVQPGLAQALSQRFSDQRRFGEITVYFPRRSSP